MPRDAASTLREEADARADIDGPATMIYRLCDGVKLGAESN